MEMLQEQERRGTALGKAKPEWLAIVRLSIEVGYTGAMPVGEQKWLCVSLKGV